MDEIATEIIQTMEFSEKLRFWEVIIESAFFIFCFFKGCELINAAIAALKAIAIRAR